MENDAGAARKEASKYIAREFEGHNEGRMTLVLQRVSASEVRNVVILGFFFLRDEERQGVVRGAGCVRAYDGETGRYAQLVLPQKSPTFIPEQGERST